MQVVLRSLGVVLIALLGVVLVLASLEGISDCDLESMIGCGHRGSCDSVRMGLVDVV